VGKPAFGNPRQRNAINILNSFTYICCGEKSRQDSPGVLHRAALVERSGDETPYPDTPNPYIIIISIFFSS
jgi:hypothetical protein